MQIVLKKTYKHLIVYQFSDIQFQWITQLYSEAYLYPDVGLNIIKNQYFFAILKICISID